MEFSLLIKTRKKQEIVDITEKVREIIKKSKIDKGICVVSALHTTSAIIINEVNDESLNKNILSKLEELIPSHSDYFHNDGNAHAHIKASLVGHSKCIGICNGEMQLGTWQCIGLVEFDGPRERKVSVVVKG